MKRRRKFGMARQQKAWKRTKRRWKNTTNKLTRERKLRKTANKTHFKQLCMG